MRTTGPLRFQSVANNPFGAVTNPNFLITTGEGNATGMATGFRLDDINLPSDFPSDGNFTVQGFKLRLLSSFSAQGTVVNVQLTFGNGAFGGTAQTIQQFASGSVESIFGGPNNMLGVSSSSVTTQAAIEGMELKFTLANGNSSNVSFAGDPDTGAAAGILGTVPSVEIFYTTDDEATSINEVSMPTDATSTYTTFNNDFTGQTTSSSTAPNNSTSHNTGWSPSDGGGNGDYTGWENGKDCVDLATSFFGTSYSGNSDGRWIDGASSTLDSTVPQLENRFVRGWGMDTGTTPSGGTGPHGGLAGNSGNNFSNGATNSSTTNKYLYTETTSGDNQMHHLFRTPQIDLAGNDYTGSDRLFLEFWLYASGVSCGNLYIYSHSNQSLTANHFQANLLATIYCFSNNTGGSTSSTSTTVKTFARGLLRFTSGEQSTSSPFYTGSWNITSGTVTANNSDYDTSYIRCRIPIHGDYNGTAMSGGDLRTQNSGRHHFYFLHQPHENLTQIASSRTNSGGSGSNTNVQFVGFRGDMAIDQIAIVKVDGGNETITSINEVPAASFGDFNAVELDL